MKVELADIPLIPSDWQTEHTIKALAVNGRAPAMEALLDWYKSAPEDFKKIMKVIRLIGSSPRVHNPRHVKKDRKSDIHEIRADQGRARLFFFYSEDRKQIVICTNAYWKTKSSESEQERAFERARDLKALYEKNHN